MKLDGWIERFCEQFNTKILDYLYKFNEYGSKAEIEWNDISLDDKVQITEKLVNAVQAGLLAPEEVREYVINAFYLKKDDNAYNQMKKDKEKAMRVESEVKANSQNGMQGKKEKVTNTNKKSKKEDSED